MLDISLTHYLVLAALLFVIGLMGVFIKRNAIAVLMCIEIMLNAVNINLVAANHYLHFGEAVGQLFAVFVIVVAAAEVAVGLALIIAMFRLRASCNLDDFNLMKW